MNEARNEAIYGYALVKRPIQQRKAGVPWVPTELHRDTLSVESGTPWDILDSEMYKDACDLVNQSIKQDRRSRVDKSPILFLVIGGKE